MSKKSKNKILIIFIYFISFFIFELIIGVGGIEKHYNIVLKREMLLH